MISRFFINRPIVAIVIAIVTVIGGLIAMSGLPLALFPEILPPQVIVSTNYIQGAWWRLAIVGQD